MQGCLVEVHPGVPGPEGTAVMHPFVIFNNGSTINLQVPEERTYEGLAPIDIELDRNEAKALAQDLADFLGGELYL
jgi:hypothetical protein